MGFGSSKRRKHSKPGKTTLRAFHFRIEANNDQSTKLHRTVTLAWELRNEQALTLEASRKAARAAKLLGAEPSYLSALDLKKMVASACVHPKFCALHSQVRQDISARVVEGQSRWFEALKEGRRHVRPPGLIARKNYRSIMYPQYGAAAHIKGGRLYLSKLGDYRLIGWRKMRGAKKTVTIKWKEGHWWAIVMCQAQERDVCRPYAAVCGDDANPGLEDTGVDPGLAAVMTDSLGKSYDTPKPLKKAKAKLRHLQKDVSRKFEVRKKLHLANLAQAREASGSRAPVADGLVESLRTIAYSGRLRRSIKKLAKAHTKVERVRGDAAKKTARKIERKFARAAVEEHGLMFMLRNRRLAKAASDVAIGKQKFAMKSALGKGRYAAASNVRPGKEGGNSQTCLCGASAPKTLKDRWHKCYGDDTHASCGLEGPRDQVSAIICQYETFGTLPVLGSIRIPSKDSAAGLVALEQKLDHPRLIRAVEMLKQRRGEDKGKAGESRRAESAEAAATRPQRSSESSKKRLAPGRSVAGHTVGGNDELILVPSAEAKTVIHKEAGNAVSPATAWDSEAKPRLQQKLLTTRRQGRASRVQNSRSPQLQVGE